MNNPEKIGNFMTELELHAAETPTPLFSSPEQMGSLIANVVYSLLQTSSNVRTSKSMSQAVCYLEPEQLLAICMLERNYGRKLLGRERYDELRMVAADKITDLRESKVAFSYNLFNRANLLSGR